MSGYPPGVTGMEPEIAGWPPCGECSHGAEDHPTQDQLAAAGRRAAACEADGCSCTAYTPWAIGEELHIPGERP